MTPRVPIYMDADGKPHTDPQDILETELKLMTYPVQWTDITMNMKANGVTEWYEVGCDDTLQKILARMDPELLEKAILDRKEKTGKYPKAIVPVALYGMPYNCDKLMAVANKYGIPVVEDAAEGFGSKFKGQVLGTFGKYGVLSFNGNKMITTSGGGALITANDNEWREIMMYATQYRESYPYY